MAEHLRAVAKRMWMGWLGFLLSTVPAIASAETLVDPTRPPALIATEQPGSVPAGPMLQSVLISPKRKEAIIAGKTVRVGDKFGEARVIKISENEVVLRNGSEMQTLKLFPDVEKKPVTALPGTLHESRRNNVKHK